MARNQIMPSNRRIKVFGLLVFISVITLLFYTGSMRQSRAPDTRTANDFYSRTVNALNHEHDHVGGGSQLTLAKAGAGEDDEDEDDEGRRERLKEAAKVAKGNANAKAPKPDPPSLVVGKGSAAEGSVAGRKSFPVKDKDGEGADQKLVVETVETPEEHEVEVELNSILKKSPIIVFSKSYCPHSKRAKNVLEKYTIDPKPYIVELDLHPLGLQIQASLADMTGRRTVPNILINGKSIGGGDEVSGLDTEGKLIETVKRMGGKRMLEVSKKVAGEKNEDASGDKQHDSALKKRGQVILEGCDFMI